MNRISILLIATLTTITALAQNNQTEGMIYYTEVTKLDINIEGLAPGMESLIPSETKHKTVLYFNANTSLYTNDNCTDTDDRMEENGGSVQIMMGTSENIIYRNLSEGTSIEQSEFMSRYFLIEQSNQNKNWTLTDKHKTIAGFSCQEATSSENDQQIRVWFTSEIPVASGPGHFANLPGMILQIESDNNQRTITATQVVFENIEQDKIIKPKKGKKLTAEAYQEMVIQKTMELVGSKGGKGSNVVIIKSVQ